MKKKILSMALAVTMILGLVGVFTPVIASAALNYEFQPGTGWKLVWHDEFDGVNYNGGAYTPTTGGRGGGVDKSNWGFQNGNGGAEGGNPGWGNGESENYIPEMASVITDATAQDGKSLNMHAQAKTGSGYTDLIADGGTWYSAKLITSKLARNYKNGDNNARGSINPATGYDGTYGRIEARIKLPNALGTWPAFWMMPSLSVYGGWAASGEIDIMEQTSGENTTGGTIHCGGPWPGNYYRTQSNTFPAGESSKDWHVYAVEWYEDRFTWYVDDRTFGTRYNTEWGTTGAPGNPYAPFDQDFYMILNLATNGTLGGNRNPDGPVDMYVDYVRVYEQVREGTGVTSVSANPGSQQLSTPEAQAVTVRGWNLDEAVIKVGIEGDDLSTYVTATAAPGGATATAALPATSRDVGPYNIVVLVDGVANAVKGVLDVTPDFPTDGKYYLVHKDTGKIVGTDLSDAAFMAWAANQATYKAIFDSTDGIEKYTLFDLTYGFTGTRAYLQAGNNRYLTIEGGAGGGFGGTNIDARTEAKGAANTSWEALVFYPQADETIKISNISTTGERWINVVSGGNLQMATAQPGDSGKFYLVEYEKKAPVISTSSLAPGFVGAAYSATLAVSQGSTPITWTLDDGDLPDGLLLSTAGVISGTPSAAGTFNFTVKVTNEKGSDTKALSISVTVPEQAPVITTTSLAGGFVGAAYNQTLQATGDPVINWTLDSGSLGGLSLSSTGVISGTPSATGTLNFTVKATNGVGFDTKALSITIGTQRIGIVASNRTAIANAATASSQSSGTDYPPEGGGPVTGFMPVHALNGLYNNRWGTAGWTAALPNNYVDEEWFDVNFLAEYMVSEVSILWGAAYPGLFKVQAWDGADWFDVTVNGGSATAIWDGGDKDMLIDPATTLVNGTVHYANGTRYMINDGDTVIVGIPGPGNPNNPGDLPRQSVQFDEVRTSKIRLQLLSRVDLGQGYGMWDFEAYGYPYVPPVPVEPTITTAALPDGTEGEAYSFTLSAIGDTPITWSGTLPAGLSLSSAGVISGTPNAAGTFNDITITATNDAGSDSKSFSLKINAAAVDDYVTDINYTGTLLTTYAGSFNVTTNTAGATVIPSTAAVQTISWSYISGPTGAMYNAETGVVTLGAAGAGYIVIRATVAGGGAGGADFTKDISIRVFNNVTSITAVAESVPVGVAFPLTGTVNGQASGATNRTIVWTVEDAGTTGATISGGTLNTTDVGTVVVKATIAGGVASVVDGAVVYADYTQLFNIDVTGEFIPVTAINYTGAITMGLSSNLNVGNNATVVPSDATIKTIQWSIFSRTGASGAVINATTGNVTSGGGAANAGVIVVRATITGGGEGGTNFIKDITIYIGMDPPPAITTESLPDGKVDVAYSFALAATYAPTGWSATGLPAGLSISDAGVISGTPTVSGTFSVTVTATNGTGNGSKTFDLYIEADDFITLNENQAMSIKLAVGASVQLLIDTNLTDLVYNCATTYVIVDANGVVTGIKGGMAVITVTSASKPTLKVNVVVTVS